MNILPVFVEGSNQIMFVVKVFDDKDSAVVFIRPFNQDLQVSKITEFENRINLKFKLYQEEVVDLNLNLSGRFHVYLYKRSGLMQFCFTRYRDKSSHKLLYGAYPDEIKKRLEES